MKKIFYIIGGAGRIVTTIPALRKYAKLHPKEDWNVLISRWDALFWGIPELQDRIYSSDAKGIFDTLIMKADKIVAPEPYHVPGYFKQELSLAEAFDVEINNTKDQSDLEPPVLVLSRVEKKSAAHIVTQAKQQQKKPRTIVIQPFGSSTRVEGGNIVDDYGSRSLDAKSYVSLVRKLSARYNIIFFGAQQFRGVEDITYKPHGDLRMWAAIIDAADYFIGCDSVGQHMARALRKPGTVILGSTFAVNVSYPNYFNIIEKPGVKKYCPFRLCGLDVNLADRLNEGRMSFTPEEVDAVYKNIIADIKKKIKA